jgi:hypothetical protein
MNTFEPAKGGTVADMTATAAHVGGIDAAASQGIVAAALYGA